MESSIMALAQDVAALRGPATTLCEAVPRASKGAIGAVDRFIQEMTGVTRTLASVLKQMWGITLSVEMEVLPWLVRHATWILNRFQGHARNNGTTAYWALHDRHFTGNIFRFGQPVHAHVSDLGELPKLQERWAAGVWFGKTFATDSHIVLTE